MKSKRLRIIVIFIIGLISLPILALASFIGYDIAIVRWDQYWLDKNLSQNKYNAVCLMHSYTVSLRENNNTIQIGDYIIPIDKKQLLMADDGLWVVWGKSNGNFDTFNVNREYAEKHFEKFKTEHCIKVENE